MKTINVGFIGAGDVADLHADAVFRLPGAELKGLWDRDAENGLYKARLYECRTVYTSAEELFNDPEIDVVFILTNMETHAKYTIQAARAGKHILVEKPAASNVAELLQMQQAVEEAGVHCMPGHNYIYEAGVERMRQMIQSGKLGTITQFYMMYNIEHAEEIRARYPGVIRQILTHHAYTTLYLAGQAQSVSCFRSTINGTIAPQENVAMVNMKMKSGALSHLCASFANDDQSGDPWTCLIKVIGTKGSARYSYRDWVINTRNGAHSQTFQAYPESIKNTATYFIDRVIRQGEAPLSSLEDALTCQRIIEACEQSVTEGRHVSL
jgi:predicted dehydrogenase